MFNSVAAVLLPTFFVLALGYFAGRSKRIKSNQISGLDELAILYYALPASIFVGISSIPRDRLLQQSTFFLALSIAFLGFYLIIWLASRFVFHHTVGAAALQAVLISSPTALLMGMPILSGRFGAASTVVIAMYTVLINVIQTPLTLILIEVEKSQQTGEHSNLNQIFRSSMSKSIKAPLVWVPFLAIVIVLLGVKVPRIVDEMLNLIGATTSGIAIFFAGLTLAAYKLRLNREVIINSILKVIVQPLLMVVLLLLFSIPNPTAQEGVVACALPTGVIGVVLASHYQIYASEASSTLFLASVMTIVTLPIAIALTGH